MAGSTRDARDAGRASRIDGVVLTVVSIALLGVITGSVFVMTAKRSTSYIFPVDAAYPGGLVAVISAAVVLLGSLFLRHPAANALQALISGLVFGLPAWSSFLTARRASSALEGPSSEVYTGQLFYASAAALVAVAALLGIVRHRLAKRTTSWPPRERQSPPPPRAASKLPARRRRRQSKGPYVPLRAWQIVTALLLGTALVWLGIYGLSLGGRRYDVVALAGGAMCLGGLVGDMVKRRR